VPAAKSSPRTIGQAAREAGVHVETVRYYERVGLIARPPAATGYRHYPEATVSRLRFIRAAQKLGLSLKEIGELAGMADAGVGCQDMCARLDGTLRELDQKIARMKALRDSMAELLRKSPRRGPHTNCGVFQALNA
jgi:DNA-binding transcriptional MerR regulator